MKYKLHVNIRIDALGPGDTYMGNGLEIREDFEVNANGFMEVAAILAKFHELAQVIEKERKR